MVRRAQNERQLITKPMSAFRYVQQTLPLLSSVQTSTVASISYNCP